MKKSWFILIAVITLSSLLLIACGGQSTSTTSPYDESEFVRPDPPGEYSDAVNPYEGDTDAIAEGQELYQQNCVSCHGPTGQGDGPAASALEPEPADLGIVQRSQSDGYLAWRITEGGLMEPFRSVMPAWKGILNEEKIWKIIAYIRTFDG
jgi:mono/diheme cytochrome c family protein